MKKFTHLLFGLMLAAGFAQAGAQNVMPDGIEPEIYLKGDKIVYVAVDDNSIYFQGLSELYPEFVVRGDFNRSTMTVSIPQNQYIARYGTYDVYSKIQFLDENTYDYYWAPEDATYDLTVNFEKGLFECPKADAFNLFVFAVYVDDLWRHADYFGYLRLTKYVDRTGVPMNPTDLELEKYEGDSFYSFTFNIPTTTTSGNEMSIYDTYYTVYVNGEVLTLAPNEETGAYEGLYDSITEIPYYFNNDNDIMANGNGHLIGIYSDNIQTIGVQTIYRFNGVETKSEVITLDVAAVDAPVMDTQVTATEYYNIDGSRVANPDRGLYIVREHRTDGTVSTRKVIR